MFMLVKNRMEAPCVELTLMDDSYFMYVDNNKTAALGAFLLLSLFARAKNETPGEKYVFHIWAACLPPQKDSIVVPMWHL